ncbi:SWIM zinc finger family protein [Acaryochloris sp. IP29b_bin.137]|uniref:SWIM zinc finger family protein n=1 Tax=Acaryochloris sp. IP29b_bin.137 TaxID=2969217 RepID=UPI00260C1CDC|nr:SWIM zinc finger family protein [Acaryochloris sp. IP29b_bin.137]
MANFSRTWWGQRFLAAIEQITDPGRLGRGRSYARGNKVKSFTLKDGLVKAEVRGSVNPYFGVYKEPLYDTSIEFESISKANWAAAIAFLASKASLISRLMLNEMPDNIEDAFAKLDLNLLPRSNSNFTTQCSCPDWSNPCKHIAGVYYLLAAELDQDPFLLFELRGLSRENLQQELAKSPLGQALSAELTAQQTELEPDNSYYTQPLTTPASEIEQLKDFWQGDKRLPQTINAPPSTGVSGILVKTQGDFPAFWPREQSFLAVMEEFYDRVRDKSSAVL